MLKATLYILVMALLGGLIFGLMDITYNHFIRELPWATALDEGAKTFITATCAYWGGGTAVWYNMTR